MGKSSIKINKILNTLAVKYPENSITGYLNDVSANLILNIGPERINTILHQNWIHRITVLIQTTLDGVAQKRFSFQLREIESDLKRFLQGFSERFDFQRNTQLPTTFI